MKSTNKKRSNKRKKDMLSGRQRLGIVSGVVVLVLISLVVFARNQESSTIVNVNDDAVTSSVVKDDVDLGAKAFADQYVAAVLACDTEAINVMRLTPKKTDEDTIPKCKELGTKCAPMSIVFEKQINSAADDEGKMVSLQYSIRCDDVSDPYVIIVSYDAEFGWTVFQDNTTGLNIQKKLDPNL